MSDSEQPAICVQRKPPQTIEEVKAIVLAEFKYWKDANVDVSIGAVGAVANIFAALNGAYAPWHPKPEK